MWSLHHIEKKMGGTGNRMLALVVANPPNVTNSKNLLYTFSHIRPPSVVWLRRLFALSLTNKQNGYSDIIINHYIFNL